MATTANDATRWIVRAYDDTGTFCSGGVFSDPRRAEDWADLHEHLGQRICVQCRRVIGFTEVCEDCG